ncbi:MAG: hypothetical protein QM756_06305 [Polyangiaceae bacterium]
MRAQYQVLLETWINNWVEKWMKGWGCWPYGHIPVNIVGWAVKNASTLSGTIPSTQKVYTNVLDGGGVPECDERCGSFFVYHGGAQANYSTCPGGAASHYDLSLWLTYGMGFGGAGGDWGQRVDLQSVLSTPHIVGHEIGHGLGLPDFYDQGSNDFYKVETSADAKALGAAGFIMQAGSATTVTDFDGWMLRQLWQKFGRARYGY